MSNNRVTLTSVSNSKDRVVFRAAPAISESQQVQYQPVQPTQTPGAIQVFTSSPSRIFSLQPIILFSRTSQEALENLQTLNKLRGWTKPYFGATNNATKKLGSPPDVLLLNAYAGGSATTDSAISSDKSGNLRDIPVVITTLGVTYPNDVDYIPCAESEDIIDGTPFPTVMQLDITLIETHSPREYAKFDLDKYKRGILTNF